MAVNDSVTQSRAILMRADLFQTFARVDPLPGLSVALRITVIITAFNNNKYSDASAYTTVSTDFVSYNASLPNCIRFPLSMEKDKH